MRPGDLFIVENALGLPLEVDEASLPSADVSWLVDHAWNVAWGEVVTD